jgi:D-aminoacyl-tRNA deacylase
VTVDGQRVTEIGPGLLVLLGVRRGDGGEQADRMTRKLLALRLFEDEAGRMNRSVVELGGELLCVSQFTVYADTRKGNRPSFVDAAPAELAESLYERVREGLGAQGGVFRARMSVALVNDGPVTLLVDV